MMATINHQIEERHKLTQASIQQTNTNIANIAEENRRERKTQDERYARQEERAVQQSKDIATLTMLIQAAHVHIKKDNITEEKPPQQATTDTSRHDDSNESTDDDMNCGAGG